MSTIFFVGYFMGIAAVAFVLIIKEAIKDHLDLANPIILYSSVGASFIGIITLGDKWIDPILIIYSTITIPFIFPYLFECLSLQKPAKPNIRNRRQKVLPETKTSQTSKRGEQ
ncbi:MAG: hypothetical protein A2283_04815 [Lentisphaerae bacterium RIFOXYA12_FULL_48_11]|nr:MAG: hypothetical protein A2283_04815 [Lentisphaerae bacterium RIFOXYA12_FULL_48_11]